MYESDSELLSALLTILTQSLQEIERHISIMQMEVTAVRGNTIPDMWSISDNVIIDRKLGVLFERDEAGNVHGHLLGYNADEYSHYFNKEESKVLWNKLEQWAN